MFGLATPELAYELLVAKGEPATQIFMSFAIARVPLSEKLNSINADVSQP